MMTIMLTGANGYVGSFLNSFFKERSWDVRLPIICDEKKWRFLESIPQEQFKGIDVLIHAAWDMDSSDKKKAYDTNVLGSKKLIDEATKAGVKQMIFISTMSAYEGCSSCYGKTKLMVEQEVLKHGGIVIRPGLIYGQHSGGMIGKLSTLVQKLPIVPLPCADKKQYLIDERRVVDFICRVVAGETPSGIYSLANPVPVTMKEIILNIASDLKKKILIIAIPWRLVWLGLFAAQLLRLKLPVNTDNLIGLAKANPAPDFSSFNKYAT